MVNSATVKPAIIGSNTAVSRVALTSISGATNSILGFAFMEGGFTFSNSATACSWSSVFPCSGPITLAGGTLTLLLDLNLVAGASLVNTGTIAAAGHIISTPPQITSFSLPSGLLLSAADVVVNSDITVNGPVTFNGVCSLGGNNYTVNLTNGSFIIGSGSILTLRNAQIQGISAGKISCVDSTGTLILTDVGWAQTGDYTFSQGALRAVGDVIMTGTSIFTYSSLQTCTIASNSTWFFDSGMALQYSPVSNQNLISFTDVTSQLYLYETTLQASAVGMRLSKGTVLVDGLCSFVSTGTSVSNGIQLGDGVSSVNDLQLKILPESGILQTSGYVVYQNIAG